MRQTYTATLKVIECCNCHMDFGMTQELYEARKKDHDWFYCPAGHKQYFTAKSKEEKLRDEVAREKHLREQAEARHEHFTGAMTRSRRYATQVAKRYANSPAQKGAFWKGFEARMCGSDETCCPYPDEPRTYQFRRVWMEGFECAG